MGDTRRLYDVTVPIRAGMAVYEGDPDVRLIRTAAIEHGDVANVSQLDFGVHTGTHVDAPAHFIDGAATADALPLDALLGPVRVIDATRCSDHIDAEAIASFAIVRGTERVLFKTGNSQLWERGRFSPDFIALTEDAAISLVALGIRLVGIDYLSIAPAEDPAPTHLRLLEASVVIVEGLNLRGVEPGEYELMCLPLLIAGSDGAPARVLLRGMR